MSPLFVSTLEFLGEYFRDVYGSGENLLVDLKFLPFLDASRKYGNIIDENKRVRALVCRREHRAVIGTLNLC